jgi:hypothetical protein
MTKPWRDGLRTSRHGIFSGLIAKRTGLIAKRTGLIAEHAGFIAKHARGNR